MIASRSVFPDRDSCAPEGFGTVMKLRVTSRDAAEPSYGTQADGAATTETDPYPSTLNTVFERHFGKRSH